MQTVFAFIIGIQPAASSNGFFHLFSHFPHTFICIGNSHLVNYTPSTDLVSLILLQQQGRLYLPGFGHDFRRLNNGYSSLTCILEESSGSLRCLIIPDHQTYSTAIGIYDNFVILTSVKVVFIHSFYEVWWFFPLIMFYKNSHLSSWQPCAPSVGI